MLGRSDSWTQDVVRAARHVYYAWSLGILAAVAIWWFLVAGAVTLAMPTTAASAPKADSTAVIPRADIAASADRTARVHLPGLSSLPIPTERQAFDEAQRGFQESDESAIERAFKTGDWILVTHDQPVRLTAIDGEAVEVEILVGVHAGRRGWLKARQLVP
jgi:hypothetical protein